MCDTISVSIHVQFTVFTRSDAAATISFIHQCCAPSIQEQHLFHSANAFAVIE